MFIIRKIMEQNLKPIFKCHKFVVWFTAELKLVSSGNENQVERLKVLCKRKSKIGTCDKQVNALPNNKILE